MSLTLFSIPPADPSIHKADVGRAMKQTDWVLAQLQRGPLSASRARNERGINRLAARVQDLRNAGYNIPKAERKDGDWVYTLKGVPDAVA